MRNLRPLLLLLPLCIFSVLHPTPVNACVIDTCDPEQCYETCYGVQGCAWRTCHLGCLCGAPIEKAYLDQLQPGFTTDYVQGGLVISTVLPGSPANEAGIVPGDRILLIDGRAPWLLPCESQVWDDSHTTLLTLLHGNESRDVAIRPKPIRELLGALWTKPTRPYLRNAALSTERVVDSYAVGMRFVAERGGIRALEILPGGAAERGGVRSGDLVVKVNGAPAAQYDFTAASAGELLQFDILRGFTRVRLPVTVQGLSSLFRSSGVSSARNMQLVASR